MTALLQVKNLQTSFFTPEGEVRAIDGVSFEIEEGRTLGLVGESGCGKSVTSLSIMRLIASPPGRIVGGEILYKGRDLLKLSNEEMRRIRGNEISMIFQEPMTSLNPVFTVGDQIGEAIRLHQGLGKREARKKTIEMLRLVKIADPESRVDHYPHQMSGGMRQRVMIAMALSCNPSLLIADEPTTALDVTIQAQILELMKELQQKIGMALLLITHDLGVVAEQADDVAIMYAGKIVERSRAAAIFSRPLHPYTVGLLNSLPGSGTDKRRRLRAIPGVVPSPLHLPSGCRFRDRCPKAAEICATAEPALTETEPGHWAACYFPESQTASAGEGAPAQL
ncbi:MAG TPA: ABC transporter ATP-binding protein [candidate division Zixibacteria bacterium]|nr:ABC transporter ATP-binding protein [candidate division Zixibacteria bacterium]